MRVTIKVDRPSNNNSNNNNNESNWLISLEITSLHIKMTAKKYRCILLLQPFTNYSKLDIIAVVNEEFNVINVRCTNT